MTDSNHFLKNQTVTGSLCYIRDGEQVLLLRRKRPPHQGKWTAPGGKVQFGESPDECVIREIREETGLIIDNPTLRAIVSVYDRDWPIHWLLFIYLTHEFTGEVLPQDDEGELRWMPYAQMHTLDCPYTDMQYFPFVIGDLPGVWRGKFVYDTPDTLVEEIIYAPQTTTGG